MLRLEGAGMKSWGWHWHHVLAATVAVLGRGRHRVVGPHLQLYSSSQASAQASTPRLGSTTATHADPYFGRVDGTRVSRDTNARAGHAAPHRCCRRTQVLLRPAPSRLPIKSALLTTAAMWTVQRIGSGQVVEPEREPGVLKVTALQLQVLRQPARQADRVSPPAKSAPASPAALSAP